MIHIMEELEQHKTIICVSASHSRCLTKCQTNKCSPLLFCSSIYYEYALLISERQSKEGKRESMFVQPSLIIYTQKA